MIYDLALLKAWLIVDGAGSASKDTKVKRVVIQ